MPGGRSTAAAAQCRSGWRGWRRWSLDSSHVHMQPMPATMHALEKAAGNHAVRGHALQHPLRIVPVAAFDVGQDFSRSEEHTSELQSQSNLVCRLLLEKKKK